MKVKITAQGTHPSQWDVEFEISPTRKSTCIKSLEEDNNVKKYYIKPENNLYDDVVRYIVRVIYRH